MEAAVRLGILSLLAAASSVLASLSFPTHDLGFLAWFGLAPFLWALRRKGPLSASWLGFLFGFGICIGAFSWILKVPGMDIPLFLIMSSQFSLFFALFGLLYNLVDRRIGRWMTILGPSVWVGVEFLRSNASFVSLPWNLLGHSQHGYLPIIQIADVTGVYGVSFFLVLVNQVLSKHLEGYSRRIRGVAGLSDGSQRSPGLGRKSLAAALATLFILGYGGYRMSEENTPGKRLRVAIVQANLVLRSTMSFPERMNILGTYTKMTRDVAREKPDLVVWPASSLPMRLPSSLIYFDILSLAREINAYLLVGWSGGAKGETEISPAPAYSNTEYLVSPVPKTVTAGRPAMGILRAGSSFPLTLAPPIGSLAGEYRKIHLLAFHEYLPLEKWVRWPRWLTGLDRSFLPGEEFKVFQVLDGRFGAPICWENMFPGLFRRFVASGANFMVSVSNEAFYGDSAAPYQILAMLSFRAVENRVSVVRCTTTGISGFIAPDGRILDTVRDANGRELFATGVLTRDVQLSDRKTFYTRYGDLFAGGVGTLGGLAALYAILPRRRVPDEPST